MKTINSAQLRKVAGYTIDQTILVVAIIAVLITLIIASIGWDLLSRAGGAQVSALFKQIEDANSSFYARMGAWPDVAVGTSSAANNILVLNDAALLDGAFAAADHVPSLGGMADNTHNIGQGGVVTQALLAGDTDPITGGTPCGPAGTSALLITMTNVPFEEAQAADRSDDGDSLAGRVQYLTTAGNVGDVVYCANAR